MLAMCLNHGLPFKDLFLMGMPVIPNYCHIWIPVYHIHIYILKQF